VAYLIGKLKYLIPTRVITYISHAITVNKDLNIIFAVNIDCILKPDNKAKDRKINPKPKSLNTIL
tara:strand:- start:16 stop:210 length:195 start_codon:yes stop_codon:yes gene_type:complete